MMNRFNNKDLLLWAAALAGIVLTTVCIKKNRKRSRTIWCKSWLRKRTKGRGLLNMLNEELKTEDIKSYRNFLRLTDEQFNHLLDLTKAMISKKDTLMRQSISAQNRLEITLRFLATGETFRSLMYSCRVHESTISIFIPEVCRALVNVLSLDYLVMPRSPEEWKTIATDFENLWQFPHCLGAIDGRHITFRAPVSSGSYYYNYKGTHSIVLLGLVDAKYIFRYVNIGVNGRISDGGVFNQSQLGIALKDCKLNLPPPEPLPGQSQDTPYVIIADDAFPCLPNLTKPYSAPNLSYEQRVFNYRLSRARRVVESAFGILANRFRVLLNPINLCPSKVELITLTCVLLHNYISIENNSSSHLEDRNNDDITLQRVGRQGGNRSSISARLMRENFKIFFNSELGSVPWQNQSVERFNY